MKFNRPNETFSEVSFDLIIIYDFELVWLLNHKVLNAKLIFVAKVVALIHLPFLRFWRSLGVLGN